MLRKRISKFSLILLTLAMTASAFSGCSSKTPNTDGVAQVITYNLGAEPKTIDPALNDAVDGATVISNAFEGLARLDDKENPIPGVAKDWKVSQDGLNYTFNLRKEATWSDGQPVKAQDFEFAWKRALNPDTGAEYAYQLFYLKNGEAYNGKQATADAVGVKAKDDYTLEVTLEYPTAYFLSLMAFPTYFPVRKDVVEKDPKAWSTKPESYICNGPFKMKEWKPKDVLTFVKNDKYWNAKNVKLETLNYKMIDQATSALSAFRTNEMDFIESPPSQEIPGLLADKTAKIYPYLGVYYLEFNLTDKAKELDADVAKALSDVRVRKALTLAIDRKVIVDNVTKGEQIPAGAFVPNGIPEDKSGKEFRNKDYYNPKGDITEAKRLLAEAGYPDGKGFPKLIYLYNTNEGHQNIAVAIQDMWKKNLNIQVELKNEEWKVFQKTRTDKNYLLARAGWIADYVDPMTFIDLLHSKSGNNDPGYNNPDYDAKVMAAKKETDPAKRMKYLHDAENILMKDMPVIPIYFYTNVVCMKPYLKGIHKSPLGFVFFDKAYVEKH